jgi:hypothetical protein
MDKYKGMNGRRFRTEGLIEIPIPPPYDPTAMPGAIVLGQDGCLYASTKNDPTSSYSWARFASLIGDKLSIGVITPRNDFYYRNDTPTTGYTPAIQIEGLTTSTASLSITGISGEPSGGRISLGRAEGTQANRTVVQDATQLGTYQFLAYDGAKMIPCSSISSAVAGSPGIGAVPADLKLRTSVAVSDGLRTRVNITAEGVVTVLERLLINNSTGTERLCVTGNAQLTDSTNYFMVGTNPVVGSRKTGWAAPTGTATRSTFATSTVTTAQLAERVKALIDDLTTHGLIGA